LQNDQNGTINGTIYVVVEAGGKSRANVTVASWSISGVTSMVLAPIVTFELYLVRPISGESAVLSSGSGTITYAA
jgi:hypothetical protein